MNWLKRTLVHFSLLIGVASIVIEHDHIFSSWSHKDPEVQAIPSSDKLLSKAIQESLVEKSKLSPQTSALTIPDEIANFQELKNIKFKDSRLKLVSAFSDEKLSGQSIFADLSTYNSLVHLFREDVLGFERGTLRSGTFKDLSGFDQIYYKIYYSSGKLAHVFVKESGGVELAIYSPQSDGYQSQIFKNGLWQKDEKFSDSEMDTQIQSHLKGSARVLLSTIGSI